MQAPDPEKVPTADDEVYRRQILARSRNYLLSYALRNHEWVLWMDVDIVFVRTAPLSLRYSVLGSRIQGLGHAVTHTY